MDLRRPSVPSIKTCAVVQGNIRQGAAMVMEMLSKHFDLVILSTWQDEVPACIPRGNWELVLSDKPTQPGYSNRNFQRLSTAAGLRRAREMGATHVLKWRSDMLPTRLDVTQLMQWAQYEVPPGMNSRLVTCAFRNLSVRQDWFSTIPDLFAFGDIESMIMLWGDAGYDYARSMNIPDAMLQEEGDVWLNRTDVMGLYCPEAELYAQFKNRLQDKFGRRLIHPEIAGSYMRLIDHRRLGICWFGAPGQFRPIAQALQHPWWTEAIWENGRPTVAESGYPETTFVQKLRRKHLTPWVNRREVAMQQQWYGQYIAMHGQPN